MLPKIVKCSLVLAFALITVITMRITLPTIFRLNEIAYFRSMKLTVIKVYMSVTAAILIEMLVLHQSISLMYMTSDWIIMVYIPLLVYATYLTFKTFVLRLAYSISEKEAEKFLLHNWNNFVEQGDEFWLEIQLKLRCCGLEGPRTYLDYLRRVHKTCYVNQIEEGELITTGCNDVVYDQFHAVRILSIALCWFVVFVPFVVCLVYAAILIDKLQKVTFCKRRKRQTRQSFNLRSFK